MAAFSTSYYHINRRSLLHSAMSNKFALSDVKRYTLRHVKKPREICRNAGISEIQALPFKTGWGS